MCKLCKIHTNIVIIVAFLRDTIVALQDKANCQIQHSIVERVNLETHRLGKRTAVERRWSHLDNYLIKRLNLQRLDMLGCCRTAMSITRSLCPCRCAVHAANIKFKLK